MVARWELAVCYVRCAATMLSSMAGLVPDHAPTLLDAVSLYATMGRLSACTYGGLDTEEENKESHSRQQTMAL